MREYIIRPSDVDVWLHGNKCEELFNYLLGDENSSKEELLKKGYVSGSIKMKHQAIKRDFQLPVINGYDEDTVHVDIYKALSRALKFHTGGQYKDVELKISFLTIRNADVIRTCVLKFVDED